jgi:hypothetical protein
VGVIGVLATWGFISVRALTGGDVDALLFIGAIVLALLSSGPFLLYVAFIKSSAVSVLI